MQGRCRSVASIAGFTRLTGPNSRLSSASAVRKGAARAAVDPTAAWFITLAMGGGGTKTIWSGAQTGADLCGGCQLPLTYLLPYPATRPGWCWPARISTMTLPRTGRGT